MKKLPLVLLAALLWGCASVETEADILAFQERLKQRKGIKG